MNIILDPRLLGISLEDFHQFQFFAVNAIDMVWHQHNRVVHGEDGIEILHLVDRVRRTSLSHLAAWKSFCPLSPPVWYPPLWCIKINVDVAVRSSFSMAACVGKDSLGNVLHAETRKLLKVDPTIGEVEALWLGVEATLKIG